MLRFLLLWHICETTFVYYACANKERHAAEEGRFSMSYYLCMSEAKQSEWETLWEWYLGMWNTAWWWKSSVKLMVKGWRNVSGWQVRESSRGLVGYSLCMHSPSVQFLDWSTMPSQSFPPFLGAGALHSLLLQWVHSVPQVDHLLHSVHRPSTTTQDKDRWAHSERNGRWADGDKQVHEWVREIRDRDGVRYVGERHT